MDIDIKNDGAVLAEGLRIGTLKGVDFTPAKTEDEQDAKTMSQTTAQALTSEIDKRLNNIASAGPAALSLSDHGEVLWTGQPIGLLSAGDDFFKPKVDLIGGALGTPPAQEAAKARLEDFLRMEISQKLESLIELKTYLDDEKAECPEARAIVHLLYENLGYLRRHHHIKLLKETERPTREFLARMGVKLGYDFVFLKGLMKFHPSRLISLLFAFAWDKNGGGHKNPFLPPNGRPTLQIDGFRQSERAFNIAGFSKRGTMAVRFDILDRLNRLIWQARNERTDGYFQVKEEMLALTGTSLADLSQILQSMNYVQVFRDFSPEETEAYQKYADAYYTRQEAIQRAKESGGQDIKDIFAQHPPVSPPEFMTRVSPPKPASGQRRPKPLATYVALPKIDENGRTILQTRQEFWVYKPRSKSPHQRKAPNTMNASGDSAARPGNRPKRNLSEFGTFNTAQGRKPPRRSAPRTHSFAPPKSEKTSAAASPFAALAALKFDDSQDTNTPKAQKPNPKDGKD